MSDLQDLYQEVILDHNRAPRNFHILENADISAEGFNPLCGDKLTLYLRIKEERIQEACFMGSGCAISTASASLMTEAIQGKTLAQAEILFQTMHRFLTTEENVFSTIPNEKLHVLSGVKAYPSRVKCATLAWHTLQAALQHDAKIISTE